MYGHKSTLLTQYIQFIVFQAIRFSLLSRMIRDLDENKSFLVRIEIFTIELTVSPNLLRRQTWLYYREIEFLSTIVSLQRMKRKNNGKIIPIIIIRNETSPKIGPKCLMLYLEFFSVNWDLFRSLEIPLDLKTSCSI